MVQLNPFDQLGYHFGDLNFSPLPSPWRGRPQQAMRCRGAGGQSRLASPRRKRRSEWAPLAASPPGARRGALRGEKVRRERRAREESRRRRSTSSSSSLLSATTSSCSPQPFVAPPPTPRQVPGDLHRGLSWRVFSPAQSRRPTGLVQLNPFDQLGYHFGDLIFPRSLAPRGLPQQPMPLQGSGRPESARLSEA